MKIFHIQTKRQRNQDSPWQDRRIGEVVVRYLAGEPRHGDLSQTVILHISGRLLNIMKTTSSMMGRLYIRGGVKKVYPEAVHRKENGSGTSTKNREVLTLLMDMVDKGDRLVVWKLDRLARNTGDLCQIVNTLEDKGASLEVLDQKIDTGTATGKAFLQMLGVFAEFETNLRKERQLAGIAQAKAKGKHLGRRSLLTDDQKRKAQRLHKAGMNPTTLSKQFGVSRATIYNIIREL